MACAGIYVDKLLKQKAVVMFTKSNNPESQMAKCILSRHATKLTPDMFQIVDIEKRTDCSEFQDVLLTRSTTNRRVVPLLYVKGNFFADYDKILLLYQQRRLLDEILKVIEYHHQMSLPPMEEMIMSLERVNMSELVVTLCDLNSVKSHWQPVDVTLRCVGESPALHPWEIDEFEMAEEMEMTRSALTSQRNSTYMESETAALGAMRRLSIVSSSL